MSLKKIGVEKSKAYFNQADLIIFMLNASEKLSEEDHQLMALVKDKPAIIILNKTDLEMQIEIDEIKSILSHQKIIYASVQNEIGLDEIENELSDIVYKGNVEINQEEMMSNTRHIHLTHLALNNAKDALKASENHMPYDFIEVDIKDCIQHLGHVTGESVEEDLMTTIFSNFCLGK